MSFTLQNLEAAKSIGTSKEQDSQDKKPLEEVQVIDANTEPEKQFVAAFQSGQSSRENGDLEAALGFFEHAADVAASTNVKPQWMAALHASKANALFASGRVREAIAANVEAMNSTAPGDATMKLRVLKQLQLAYSDIGRLKDAEECQAQIARLQDRRSHPLTKNPPQRPGKPLPGASCAFMCWFCIYNTFYASALITVIICGVYVVETLKAALDQALESSINGQFGEIRALLSAYQDTRGGVGLGDIVNYQHSKTKASALMCAAARGETRLLSSLLSAGADLRLTAKDDSSALEWACKFNQPAAIELLIQAGATLSPEFDWEECAEEVKVVLQQHIAQLQSSVKQAKQGTAAQGRTSTSTEDIELMTNRIRDLLKQPK